MTSLEGAWEWYQAARRTLATVRRLAKYWDNLPWDSELGRDGKLQDLQASDVSRDAEAASKPLDDLAVVVMFSVFEAEVRARVLVDVTPELDPLKHPVAMKAAADLLELIQEGSFYRLLDALKLDSDKDLIEEVNQVRKYRNWVAHGRRGDEPERVTPEAAFRRLHRFLTVMGLRPEKAEPV